MKLSRLWKKKRSLHFYTPWAGSWDEAEKESAEKQGVSYGSESMARSDRAYRDEFLRNFSGERTFIDGQAQQLLSALAIVLSRHQLKSLKILDFGGGWEMYYHYLHRALPWIDLDWLIVETEVMAKTLEPCADDHVRWQSTLPEIPAGALRAAEKPFDVCLASASLQHVAPVEEIVRRLAGLGRYLLINRTPVLDIAEDQIVFQRSTKQHALSLVARLLSEQKLVKLLRSLGTMRLDWTVPQDYATFRDKSVPFKGYLVETSPLT